MSTLNYDRYRGWDTPRRLDDPNLGTVAWMVHAAPYRMLDWMRDRRRMRVAVALLLVGFAVLAALAANAEWILLEIDRPLESAAIAARTGWLNNAMVVLTFLGTRWVIGALTVAIAVWALATGRCRYAVAILVVAVLLNPLIEVAFKELIGRVRPDAARLLPGRGPSFPSGHVLASMGFYGLLPLLAWETTARYWIRRLIFFACVAIVVTVAASRVYIDVHWFSDVVAGLLLGTAIVAVSYRALHGHGLSADRRCCSPPRTPDCPGWTSPATQSEAGSSTIGRLRLSPKTAATP